MEPLLKTFLYYFKANTRPLKGTDTKFWSKITKKKIVEKASIGMGEMSPKILGGYEY